ncbi:MAG TPA: four helix bundle protein [Gemmatimonadales bacterium]|nr:four helix bundle protein [Gemmatimonadales bacterium]
MPALPLPTAPIKHHRDLVVWQRAMDLVAQAYRLTDRFPKEERFGLVQQVKRAVVSIPSNIAEGHGRDHLGDYLRHLSVANGSLMELEIQFTIAVRLGYLERDDAAEVFEGMVQVGQLLPGLVRALKRHRR